MTSTDAGPGDPYAMEQALSGIDAWQARHASVGVSDSAGSIATYGDIGFAFEVASITKLLTAWTVLVALEEGTIALDEPAGPPGATVRHLMSHTSGLDFDSSRQISAPGVRRIYSNSGYEALAAHLVAASGLTFEEYLVEGVLEPLSMSSTTLEGSAASGAVSCVADLMRFLDEMRSPTLISAETATMAGSVQFAGLAGVLPGWGRQDPCDWGLGPEVRGTKAPHWSGQAPHRQTIGHFGGSGCFLWLDTDSGLGCIALGDRPFDEWSVRLWPGFSDRIRGSYIA